MNSKPLVLLVGGIALIAASYAIGRWHQWAPLTMPVALDAGSKTLSSTFDVDLTTEYLVELQVDRSLPFERTNCLLGIAQHACDEAAVVALSWVLVSGDGKKVAEGTSDTEREGAWGSTINRTVGRFRGEAGSEYQLQVEVIRDGRALAPAKPEIAVRVHPFEAKGYYVAAQGVAAIGGIVVLVGLSYLVINLRRKRGASRA